MTQTPIRRGLVSAAMFVAALSLMGMFRSATANQPSVAAKPATRIAIVNLGKVMDGLAEAKDAKARLDGMVSDSKKKLQEINDRVKKIDSDLELMKDKKDTKEYRQLAYEKLELGATGEARQKILQQLIDEEEGATVRLMYIKMTDAVKRLAAQDGWDLVLRDDRDIVPPDSVKGRPLTGREVRGLIDQRAILTASDRIDLTTQLVTMLNNEYKATP